MANLVVSRALRNCPTTLVISVGKQALSGAQGKGPELSEALNRFCNLDAAGYRPQSGGVGDTKDSAARSMNS